MNNPLLSSRDSPTWPIKNQDKCHSRISQFATSLHITLPLLLSYDTFALNLYLRINVTYAYAYTHFFMYAPI